jgi:hypothetical protein
MRILTLRQLLAVISIAAVSGCSSLSPPITVTGTVRYHGNPVANADVSGGFEAWVFYWIAVDRELISDPPVHTDEEGHFRFVTRRKLASIGVHKVIVPLQEYLMGGCTYTKATGNIIDVSLRRARRPQTMGPVAR